MVFTKAALWGLDGERQRLPALRGSGERGRQQPGTCWLRCPLPRDAGAGALSAGEAGLHAIVGPRCYRGDCGLSIHRKKRHDGARTGTDDLVSPSCQLFRQRDVLTKPGDFAWSGFAQHVASPTFQAKTIKESRPPDAPLMVNPPLGLSCPDMLL